MLSPPCLKALWHIVDITSTGDLLTLDDCKLTDRLHQKVVEQQALDRKERATLREYIRTHLLLIRDLADGRPSKIEPLKT